MSEFKKVSSFYVSQWNGNSLNPGTAVSPYAHPADGGSVSFIVGSGFYSGGWSNVSYKQLIGDGKVVIDALGSRGGFFRPTGDVYNESIANRFIHFKNFSPIVLNALSSGTRFHFYDNIFENCTFGPFGAGTERLISYRNIFTNCPAINHTVGGIYLYNSIVENSLLANSVVFSFCFLDKNSTLVHTGGSANLNNSLLNGKIRVSGVDYELKFLFDGSPRPDADPLIPDLATAAGFSDTYTTRANFAGDEKFVDFINKVVEPDSDLLKKSSSTGFIGGVVSGSGVKKGNTDPDVELITNQIDSSNPDSWVIDSPTFNEGFVDFIFKVSDSIVQIPKIFIDSLFSFDGSEPGGSVGNNNVPDYFPANYTPLTNEGLKPNRITFKMRTSQLVTKPTSDAEWDNDSVILGTTPGAFYDHEHQTQPTINVAGGVRYGNAVPSGFGGVSNTINGRWVHIKVRLTNLREI